ncbi:hypothetical protein Tco_1509085 [Tanacetum coccineum]
MLRKLGVTCSTSDCGSNPQGNKKNDRISQKPRRNKKNIVEAQTRKVNKLNHVVKPVCDANVKHSLSNANSNILCVTCSKSMFDVVHDKCRVFTEVGLKWKPTGKTFTIIGNSRPLTRFTTTNVVPPKETTSHSDEIQKLEIKVYSKKPKNVKNIGSSKIAKIVESKKANHSEPNQSWGSNATDIPSSSSLVMPGTIRFGNDQIARIMGYGDFQLGNVDISRGCDTNLYTFSLDDMLKSSPICLLSKASKTKSWLWHRWLSHLNFACALGKSKKTSHQPKAEDTNQEKLYLLHMDLCGPMRVASINGKSSGPGLQWNNLLANIQY